MSSTFETEIKVRFSDVDPAGIAYYPRVIGFLHTAFEEFFEGVVGIPYPQVIQKDRLGFPAVRVEVEFLAPLRFGDRIGIAVSIAHLGKSSTVFHYQLRGPDGSPRADAHVTVVCVALGTLHSVALPEKYRTAFARVLEPATP